MQVDSNRLSDMRGAQRTSSTIAIRMGIVAIMLAGEPALAASSLQQQIEQMQRQLEQQQEAMEDMQRQLQQQKATIDQLSRENEKIKQQTSETKSTAEEVEQKVSSAPIVESRNPNIRVKLTGQVNRAMNFADDGKSTKYYNVDNNVSNTRLNITAEGDVTPDFTVGATIEQAISVNNSNDVSQTNEVTGTNFDTRIAEVFFKSRTFGSIQLGKGYSAGYNTARQDLSGTDVTDYASTADVAGGLYFRDRHSNDISGIRLKNAFNDFNGNGRDNRIRYNTPTWEGLYLSVDAAADQQYSGGLWYARQWGDFKVASGIGLAQPNEDEVNWRLDGSISVLHEPSGLNLTISSGENNSSDGGDQTQFYAKPGWKAKFFDFGSTNFAVDYVRSNNLPNHESQGHGVGATAVQEIKDWGTDLYAMYRWYSLDGNGVQNLNIGTLGARVKF